MKTHAKMVILDRDGVINVDTEDFIRSPADWIAIPSSLEAIAKLNNAGYKVVIATNQSGIARGYFDEYDLKAIHHKMKKAIEEAGGHIDFIAHCPHGPDDGCTCRKPLPGLLDQIEAHYHCSLEDVPFVGDSLRDLQAAEAHGAQPILVKTGNGLKTKANPDFNQQTPTYDDLASFVSDFLA
ncbi:MAG: D-glycero-beta-D-manno-heptose-1,7-bisphosphate 7-phosphatase [Kangiellaceae bacterium]|jgi:D-glycero-D-manno-heptose 1,7-bisphosphate phosphatase|nr:D-glycero-beta-D-manno-heptose-1,7-bisphosphate 7-phosphatase [Kangiellaceae bacterium]